MGPHADGPPPLKKMIFPALFVGVLFYLSFTRSPESSQQLMLQGEALGTTWTLKSAEVHTDDRAQELLAVVESALADVDQSMSTYRPDSELMAINAAEGAQAIALSNLMGRVLGEALDVGRASNGAFDVTIGPLVKAWGFGPNKRRVAPPAEVLEQLTASIGQDKLELTEAGLTKAHPQVFVDLSAIAKGFAVDLAVQRLEAVGAKNILIEVGGEIVARGKNAQGQVWRLGIETPSESQRQIHHAVALDDAAMATSGDYRQYYELDGRRVSHLIDPRTGQPIEHRLASVTVVADQCSTADAWATALSVLGEKDGFELAQNRNLKAYFIVRTEDGGFSTLSTQSFDELK